MRRFLPMLCALALLAPAAAHATGYSLAGNVRCEATGLPLPGLTIRVVSTSGPAFSGSSVSDEYGAYAVELPGAGDYQATADVGPDETVVFPGSGGYLFSTSTNDPYLVKNWVIASPTCSKPEGMCWLTGGGARFDPNFDYPVAEFGRRHNFGGNVYPGCSSTAGDGGQWNHVDYNLKRHFQGFQIHVDRCGNVDGIPPGSDSPVTPYNFIEFSGTGRVKGVKGNKESYPLVYFVARCEDRNEPGSTGPLDGDLRDRYFLHVFTDPNDRAGSTLLLIDQDGNSDTWNPVPITHGNLQLHISSCGTAAAVMSTPRSEGAVEGALRNEFWFAAAPNPAVDFARIRFGVARDADVSLRVFDLGGRMVRQLAQGRFTAGDHSASWNLRDTGGDRVKSGVYFLQMRTNGQSRVQRVVVP